jgi:hypothetical protein
MIKRFEKTSQHKEVVNFTWLIFLWALAGLPGCKPLPVKQMEARLITPYRIVDQINDTTFFGMVTDMVADDSTIAFFDYPNKRLVACDPELNLQHMVGRAGKGPGEYNSPMAINMSHGHFYAVEDKTIKEYSGDGFFERLIGLEGGCGSAFAIDKMENFFFFGPRGDSVAIVRTDRKGKTVNSFGLYYKTTGNSFQKRAQQFRDLFISPDNFLVAVGRSYPSVETYSPDGKLLNSKLLPDSAIQSTYDRIVMQLANKPNGFSDLYTDIYLYKNKLFILHSAISGGSSINRLLVCDISARTVKLERCYHLSLPDGTDPIFDKMCVLNDSTIVVSEMISVSFCYFNIK